MFRYSLIVISTFFLAPLVGQEDPVLFTVNSTQVHLSEFTYIYNKNNGDEADYSKESLEEYLDLYIKFKLKVQRAMELQMDTIPSLNRELESYRRQLSSSYMMDNEIIQSLVKELYDRMQLDVDISHILLEVPTGANDKMIEGVRTRIEEVYNELEEGTAFEEVARLRSEDRSTAADGGRVGFVNAMLPNGFYQLETEIYNLAVHQYSGPIRTPAGFHIVRVNGRRPARGEIEAGHIFVEKKGKDLQSAIESKKRIDSMYNQLQSGTSFAELALRFSDDRRTAEQGGRIGILGINRFEKSFEDAAFNLVKSGDYSKPVETSLGWHIIQLWKIRKLEPLDQIESTLRTKIERDGRHEVAKKAKIEKIKSDNNFFINQALVKDFEGQLDLSFLTYKWKPLKDLPYNSIICSFDDEEDFLLRDFVDFLEENTRERMRFQAETPIATALTSLLEKFLDECALKYEEKNLRKKYKDYDALMREYEEGILLFEVTKNTVWDRASEDTVGLKNFYEENASNYFWPPRAVLISFKVDSKEEKIKQKFLKQITKKSRAELLAVFNKKNPVLTFTFSKHEKDDPLLEGLEWNPKSYKNSQQEDGSMLVRMIESIIQAEPKQLNEARGYIIADYQDYLENEWIETLKKRYEINVDREVFNTLIKY